jgi:cyclophilin family peptidyl-prolyl cis-trans isomerase
MRTFARSSLVLALSLLFGAVAAPLAFAQPGKDSPENPRQPDAATQPAAPSATAPEAKKEAALVYVTLSTSKGDIVLELNREKAPITVENFVKYVEAGHYDGTIFHRVIDGFMIQGGGMDKDMKEKPTREPIKNEWENGLKNVRGSIAMARKGDRRPNPSTVNSATSQFFINVVDNPRLDQIQPDGGAYAAFGKVIAGMDVVDAIKGVPTTSKGGHQNVPADPVTINSAKIITSEDAKKLAK